jgi:hypothetical protein
MSDDELAVDPDKITEPVEVAELPGDQALLLVGRLHAEGIPAAVYPPEVSTITQSYGLAPLRQVLVPKEFEAKATEIVNAINAETTDEYTDDEDIEGDGGRDD